MKHNAYKLISEILSPSAGDGLIIRPSLYCYITNDQVEHAKNIGIKADKNNLIHVYFTRIPETTGTYSEFLSTHTPIKISLSKLKSIKDQKTSVQPINISGKTDTLTPEDLKDLCGNNNYFFKFFESHTDLSKLPHAAIFVSSGILPAFTYKLIDHQVSEQRN